ncbi:MAG: hypothetical protein JWL81_1047 [Verrucomicrobiales bacterium]|nr:hypothetical protein [Verrucomicrobiales bacterium]
MIQKHHWGNRLGQAASGLLFAGLHGWAVLALYFWFGAFLLLALGVVLAYGLAVYGILRFSKNRRMGWWTGLMLPLAVMLWWIGRQPLTGLDYPKETEQSAHVERELNFLTVHGIRDFRYRTVDDFEPRWSSRSYDLDQLRNVDVFFSYWGVPQVAHVITSFVFKDQAPLAVSIELRRETDEPNTLLRGIFKQYEICYIWADERDVIALRTLHRGEEVAVHRTSLTPDQGRRLLLDMMERTNSLEDQPEFYNTLTDNCTNAIARHVNQVRGRDVAWWRGLILTGRYEKMGYDQGWLLHTQPWEQHLAASRIRDRAKAGGDGPDFSARIRTHFAGMETPVPDPAAEGGSAPGSGAAVEQYPTEK